MQKKLLLTFVFIQLFLCAKSQITFQMVYGDTLHDEARSVTKSGNGFLLLGSASNPGLDSSKIVFIKLDSAANIILTSTFYVNNLKNDYGNSIKTTSDGGLIICGATYGSNIDPTSDDILLIKTSDTFGNLSWAFVYGSTGGSDEGYSVIPCGDGGYFVAGASVSSTGNKSGYAMKVDAAGSPVWYHANTILNNSRFNKGCATADGGFVATGSTLYGLSKDLFVVKYDSSGNVKWSKRSAAAGNQEGNSVTATSDGGCIIAGSNSSDGSVNSTDLLLVKLDSSGATQWSKTYNYLYEDVATDITALANGHFAVSFYSNSTDLTAPVRSIGFLDVNSSGVPGTASYYGGNTLDNLSNAIVPTNDGGFILAGVTYEYEPKGDAILIKTDASGGTHSCFIHPASFTASSFVLTDSAGSTVSSVLPNYSSVAINPGPYTTSYSPICFDLLVPEQDHATSFNLYPNPVQSELTIRFNGIHPTETLSISDMYGRIILQRSIRSGESSIEFPGEIFKQGIYQVELRSEKEITIRKFVKVN